MSQDQVFEDAVIGIVGISLLVGSILFFVPKISKQENVSILSSGGSADLAHEIALRMEDDFEKVDVLNIQTIEEVVSVTLLNLEPANWTEEDFEQLNQITFYSVALARDAERSLIVQLWITNKAVTEHGEEVDVFLHMKTLACPWSALENYDGENAAEIIQGCVIGKGNALAVDSSQVVWEGRGN